MSRYALPPLPYDYDALEPHISARIVEVHHNRHHRAYVDGANATLDAIAATRDNGDHGSISCLDQTLAFHLSGHVLHSLYWQSMHPGGGGRPAGELAAAIDDHLGGFDALRTHMSRVVATMQGSGWAALSWEPHGRHVVVEQIRDHQHSSVRGAVPLMVIDAWEHAYYLQYEHRRTDYVDTIWNVIDWHQAAQRFTHAVG